MTGYPVILNGDHAEFEIEHANTPPRERPDWPLPSFDARDWAAAFCKLNPAVDEGLMIAWFANALMRGFDEHAARVSPGKVEGWREIDDAAKNGDEVLLSDGKLRWIDSWTTEVSTYEASEERLKHPRWSMSWHFPEPSVYQPLPSPPISSRLSD